MRFPIRNNIFITNEAIVKTYCFNRIITNNLPFLKLWNFTVLKLQMHPSNKQKQKYLTIRINKHDNYHAFLIFYIFTWIQKTKRFL